MEEKLKIVIEAVDKGASKTIEKINKDINNTSKSASGSTKSISSFAKSLEGITKEGSGLGKTLNSITSAIGGIGKGSDGALSSLTNLFKGSGSGFSGITAGASSSVIAIGGIAIAAVAAGAALIKIGKETIPMFMELERVTLGFNKALEKNGSDVAAANQYVKEYASDGLVTVAEAMKAYQALAAAGYDDTQVQQILTDLKDVGSTQRQANMALGEAIVTTAQGIKNGNNMLIDNIGITKNVAVMEKEYAASLGKTAEQLTEVEKREALLKGIREGTQGFEGSASDIGASVEGSMLRMKNIINEIKVEIGGTLAPAFKVILDIIEPIMSVLKEVFNYVGAIVTQVFQLLAPAVEMIKTTFVVMLEPIKFIFSTLAKIGQKTTEIMAKFQGPLLDAIKLIGTIIKDIFGWLGSIVDKVLSWGNAQATVTAKETATLAVLQQIIASSSGVKTQLVDTGFMAANAFKSAAKEVDKTTGAVKELKKQTFGFDELQKINAQGNTGAAGWGGSQSVDFTVTPQYKEFYDETEKAYLWLQKQNQLYEIAFDNSQNEITKKWAKGMFDTANYIHTAVGNANAQTMLDIISSNDMTSVAIREKWLTLPEDMRNNVNSPLYTDAKELHKFLTAENEGSTIKWIMKWNEVADKYGGQIVPKMMYDSGLLYNYQISRAEEAAVKVVQQMENITLSAEEMNDIRVDSNGKMWATIVDDETKTCKEMEVIYDATTGGFIKADNLYRDAMGKTWRLYEDEATGAMYRTEVEMDESGKTVTDYGSTVKSTTSDIKTWIDKDTAAAKLLREEFDKDAKKNNWYTRAKDGIKDLWNGIKGLAKDIGKGVSSAWNAIFGAPAYEVEYMWTAGNEMTPQEPTYMARGGVVDRATNIIAGEAGKEAVMPLENNTGWITELASKLNGGTNNTPQNIQMNVDSRRFAEIVISSLNQYVTDTGSLPILLG